MKRLGEGQPESEGEPRGSGGFLVQTATRPSPSWGREYARVSQACPSLFCSGPKGKVIPLTRPPTWSMSGTRQEVLSVYCLISGAYHHD